MKLIASGDHHFHVRGGRWDECTRVHDWIGDLVEAEQPDLFLSGGDIYETGSTPEEREAVAAWLKRIADVCPVVIARGNHDRRLDVALMRRIKAAHPIVVEERCSVHFVGGAAVATVAWPSTASVAVMLGDSPAPRESTEGEMLRAVLRGLGATMADKRAGGLPRILLGHFMVDGSMTSNGQPLIGQELRVGLEDLGLSGADLTLMAHIHLLQEWSWQHADGRTMPIVYTGSPYRTAYGELETKSVVLAEFAGPHLLRWERIPTPCQPMVLFDGCFENGQLDVEAGYGFAGDLALVVPSPDIPGQPGADVRVRYEVAADQREAARVAAEEFRRELLDKWYAARVTLEPVVRPATRQRTPAIAAAKTLPEKLQALWKARGEDITAEREARVLAKLNTLEESAA